MENRSGKNFIGKVKYILKPIIIFVLLAIPIISISNLRKKDTYDNSYKNWAGKERFAHISVLLSEHSEFSIEDIYRFRSILRSSLEMDNATENESGTETWTDCYSAKGKVEVDIGLSTEEITAYGIGGSFFNIHPFRLLSGSYFSDENVMDDLIVIDEDLAWQLFGSKDIIGMTVVINQEPYIVSGVIKRESGMFNSASGNKKTAIYMSYSALKKYNSIPITNYEVVMPNLTKGYAYKIVKKEIGVSEPAEIVQVSGRLSYSNLLKAIKNFGKNSMQVKAIEYPFWENKARAFMNISAVLFLIFIIESVLLLLYIIIKCIVYFKKNQKEILEKADNLKYIAGILLRKIKIKIFGKKVNTVILDIGMVLADFMPKEHIKDAGIAEDRIEMVMKAVVDNEIWDEYDKGIMTYEEALHQLIKRTPKLEKEIRKVFGDLNGIIKKHDYTDSLISELKNAGYRVLYLSNLSEKLYKDCEQELSFINNMDGGIFSFEAKMKKPDKDIYELIIRKYNLTPDKCVFFDDREINLRAAGELGINTFVFDKKELVQKSKDGYDFRTMMTKISGKY